MEVELKRAEEIGDLNSEVLVVIAADGCYDELRESVKGTNAGAILIFADATSERIEDVIETVYINHGNVAHLGGGTTSIKTAPFSGKYSSASGGVGRRGMIEFQLQRRAGGVRG